MKKQKSLERLSNLFKVIPYGKWQFQDLNPDT